MLKFNYYPYNLTLFKKYTITRAVFVHIFKFYSKKMYIKNKIKDFTFKNYIKQKIIFFKKIKTLIFLK